jgi:hypothetical protein
MAFPRYADKAMERKFESTFQAPRGEHLKRINAAELFKVQKTKDHWPSIARSKAYLADKFIPPFEVPLEENLRNLLAEKDADIPAKLLEIIPNINHDQLVNLSLYLAFEAKLNDKNVWRAIEDASLTSLHLLNITEISQLEWASTQLKPKQTTPRFNTLLIKSALEKVDTASSAELMHIMQGFRNKENKGMY